ncbi:XRE family transcriptional regulator [Nocardia fluminea]|uniref:XRE family transcriptional regulator n=1 Tax=Nocardia fluminea TaxID=134984 RepID=UPI0036534100
MAIKYLGLSQVAERIGVVPGTLKRYKLPPPDALVGASRGWLPQTIDDWNDRRPGAGSRDSGRWELPPELR